MPTQDRTNEFRSCVESIRNRSALPRNAEQKARLLQHNTGGESSKSEFSRMAASIGKDISSTTIKLGKLAQRTSQTFNPNIYILRGVLTVSFGLYSGQAQNAVR
jgi:hypothetical protein